MAYEKNSLSCDFSVSISSYSSSISLWDKAAVGSSIITMRASMLRAREMATRCLFAIPKSRSLVFGSISAPIAFKILMDWRSISAQSMRPIFRVARDQEICSRQQKVRRKERFLVNGCDTGVCSRLGCWKLNWLSVYDDFSGIRLVNPG